MYESTLLAERIKSYAKLKKIALKAIFEECGLGRNTMANLTSGRSIAHDSLAKIADCLGCSVDYLLGRTDNPEINKRYPMNANIDFEKLHRTVLKKLAADNYALCGNNVPCKESEIELYRAIAIGATEAARQMLEEYHRELISSD